VLLGDCAGGDTQLWEPESPELHAKAYGMFKSKYDNQCLYTAIESGSTSTGPVHRAICKKYHPEATWTLTMDGELKSDADIDGANCLTTTGAVAGEWYAVSAPDIPIHVTMEGSKVIAKRPVDDPSVTIEGDVSKYPDGGGKLTLTFSWSGTYHATISDNKLQWDNGGMWVRKTPSLEMKPCTGASNQKWTDGDEFKSQVDDITCIQWGEVTGFFAGTCTGTPFSTKVWVGQPSWVTGS